MAIIVLVIIAIIIVACTLSKRDTHVPAAKYAQHNSQKTKESQIFDVITQAPKPSLDRITNEPLPTFKYDVSKMHLLCHATDEDTYSIPEEYRDMVLDELMKINALLDEACAKSSVVPKTRIIKENIKFNPSEKMDSDFTKFVYTPYTKTGKISKHPYYIKFYPNGSLFDKEHLFGDVYFTQNNQIGKAWIVSWLNHKCYIINCTTKEKKLQVTRIDVTNPADGSKTCLYNYNNK